MPQVTRPAAGEGLILLQNASAFFDVRLILQNREEKNAEDHQVFDRTHQHSSTPSIQCREFFHFSVRFLRHRFY
jgi:hypothetical protein